MIINGNLKLAAHLGACTTILTTSGERFVGNMTKLLKNAVEIKGCVFRGQTMVTDITSQFLFVNVKSITVET